MKGVLVRLLAISSLKQVDYIIISEKESSVDIIKSLKPNIYFKGSDYSDFSKDYSKFKQAGVEVVGISKDDVKSHRKFCDKMNIPYILLADVDIDVCKKFGVWGKKKFMGREFMGINRSTFLVNEKGKIFKVFPKVKPKGHSKEVLDCFQK